MAEIELLLHFVQLRPKKISELKVILRAFSLDWLRKIVLKDIRPYMYVMLASLAIICTGSGRIHFR